MPRNPDWTRDETTLALEVYMRVNPNHTSAKHPDVVELSKTLRSLPIHPPEARNPKFRNPDGVYMKLCNFLRHDPDYQGSGLSRGGKAEVEVWQTFAEDRERLARVAAAIRQGAQQLAPPSAEQPPIDPDEEEFAEGRLLTRLHKARERNTKATRKKKEKVLKETGRLACEVCGFDFAEVYGELGEGFAECHHRVPLAELPNRTKTRLSDLAIVGANCRRMLHRSGAPEDLEGLQAVVGGVVKCPRIMLPQRQSFTRIALSAVHQLIRRRRFRGRV